MCKKEVVAAKNAVQTASKESSGPAVPVPAPSAATASTTTATAAECRKPMTRKEVLSQSHPETNLLIIVNDAVYDCTEWQRNHPGGDLTIRALCGKDATDCFQATHPEFVERTMLKRYYHAELVEEDKGNLDDATKAYRELTVQMEKAGLFETKYRFYYEKVCWLILMLLCVYAGVFLSDQLWAHALAGATLGLFWQQAAFIGHDLGHNGITHDRITDSKLGLIFGNFCTGVGMGWWKRSHNVHHIVTNSLEHDPDIQHLPVFAVNSKYLEGPIFSTFYDGYVALSSIAHVLVKYQHYIYYPVMAFARFNLYAQSLLHAYGLGAYGHRPEQLYRRDLHQRTLLGFWTWLLCLTFCLPTWTSRILFIILSHNVAGILHVQITLSHFGMPSYSGRTYDDHATNGYLYTQLTTGLDVDCSPSMDWFHGGLQFQVVHHLWPRIPRHNLRHVQTMLIAFCKEHGFTYHHANFVDCNRMMMAKLREVSKTSKSFSELFEESFNLIG